MHQRNIVVLRFSAMGDVALLAPVLRSFLTSYPDYQITLATRPKFSAFFLGIDRLVCFSADLDKSYSGLKGIFRLFGELKKSKPEIVLDMHDHLRTWLISFLFSLAGVKIIRFDKGRKEKSFLVRKKNKIWADLPHTVSRYHQVFSKAGFSFPLLPAPHFFVPNESKQKLNRWILAHGLEKKEIWFGLAPFAAHKSKIWPMENYARIIDGIRKKMPVKFFLFGGGKKEVDFFLELKSQFPQECLIVAGELSLSEELALMGKLDKMICVDSSNMHLAALLGVPTVSIWGGTHPSIGFGPFGNKNSLVQVSVADLPCRPCSVYGKETCHRGDFACMAGIRSLDVESKMIGDATT